MQIHNFLYTLLLAVLLLVAFGEDAANDDAAAAGDDAVDDDGAANYYGDDYIKYWGSYAILPKRCIVYNDVDVIVFSVFENGYKQCSDSPTGTYITPVATFLNAYLEQKYQDNQDQGNDDYAVPDAASYTQCQQQVIENVEYYVQLGCTDGSPLSLSVNIYSDNTCTTRDSENGMDDSNIDISDIQLPFKRCLPCVYWTDQGDVDDQFYDNHQQQAPLCSTAWQYKETCDRKCQRTGLERWSLSGVNDGSQWNTSDKILLGILALFGCGMLGAILQKRRNMSNKDALLEQAAMSAAGLQPSHVIGIFVLVVIVITVFALLGMKNLTWAMLLIMNTILFGYLMKLTIDSGVSTGETVIGPDGTIIRRGDSDDSSNDSSQERNAGTYKIPVLT
mmetsp:Transcript_34818/g.39705  ORF Transcript_34818/g.39705 Transcript_34818/m.39705 type:complete len:391 (+) Transcript_34818:138-1310(+)|eukprot:CAMPEP_0194131112 /NCGR_PEP_ID=MMETSP0152-20130528/1939_1 /TAXON_ID=1049557 /ORGANISM="Thalassiothrix antarctica, Strain L6-D1" /LENGTH=390 /DNA_ID=CAMNT_0038825785 /DNA_START=110 /DNA_END=1282 /DNA_ORIENTATION=-